MPDILTGLSEIEGLVWIVAACFFAGLARGFAGFGTALIYLPVATQFLDPFWAIVTLALMDLGGPLPNVPGAWRVADRGDLARLCAGMVLLLPLGLMALGQLPREMFQWLVSAIALLTLVALVTGLRYRGEVSGAMVSGTGAAGGLLGGMAGLPGPPVILFYMARPLPAPVIRATILLFLLIYDLLLTGWLAVLGRLEAVPVVLGLALTIPGMAGNWLGGVLFVPERERLYRGVAYGLIAASALSGLPVWG